MKTRTKVLITVALAGLYVYLTYNHGVPESQLPPQSDEMDGRTTARLLRKSYAEYNTEIFDGKLPRDIVIDMDNHEEDRMADTDFKNGKFVISFNRDYVLALRVGKLTLIHEMCHVRTWGKDREDHGRRWRVCMLDPDRMSEMKKLLIDGSE